MRIPVRQRRSRRHAVLGQIHRRDAHGLPEHEHRHTGEYTHVVDSAPAERVRRQALLGL
ncbi:hypothetical protein ACIBQX_26135 [Nonomuraea sp. NPDC049714]|uniref:hypothetical protein n=1 Tax=Nonomuraea sp. NPDC049714 TaxID=3364357 RepID=UPI0037AB653C